MGSKAEFSDFSRMSASLYWTGIVPDSTNLCCAFIARQKNIVKKIIIVTFIILYINHQVARKLLGDKNLAHYTNVITSIVTTTTGFFSFSTIISKTCVLLVSKV